MDTYEIVKTLGAVIALVAAVGLPTKILILVYEMKGTITPWAERLQKHSDKIDEHDIAIIRLPDTLREIRSDMKDHNFQVTSTVTAFTSALSLLADRFDRMQTRSAEAHGQLGKQVDEVKQELQNTRVEWSENCKDCFASVVKGMDDGRTKSATRKAR